MEGLDLGSELTKEGKGFLHLNLRRVRPGLGFRLVGLRAGRTQSEEGEAEDGHDAAHVLPPRPDLPLLSLDDRAGLALAFGRAGCPCLSAASRF